MILNIFFLIKLIRQFKRATKFFGGTNYQKILFFKIRTAKQLNYRCAL
jgi:hypothetical protein